MISAVMADCGTTVQASERNRMSPCEHGLHGDAARQLPDGQGVGRRLGDFVAPLRQKRMDLPQGGAGCGCHRLGKALLSSYAAGAAGVPGFGGRKLPEVLLYSPWAGEDCYSGLLLKRQAAFFTSMTIRLPRARKAASMCPMRVEFLKSRSLSICDF